MNAAPGAEMAHGPVLVVDFGAQYAQLIARRVREARIYSEIVPHTMPVAEIVARRPSAIILSGGPESVYTDGAPQADTALFGAGIPVLGICYGLQAMAAALGGRVGRTGSAEFGRTTAELNPGSQLFSGLAPSQEVWMSHRDAVTAPPPGFAATASSAASPVAAFEDPLRSLYGLQWHPEVVHTPSGQAVIENFLYRCAKVTPNWTTGGIIDAAQKAIANQVGHYQVIAGLSGGIDSAVAAALVQRAVGDQLTCVFVDHGLLRQGEREQVEHDYVAATGVRLRTVHAKQAFLDALAALPDPTDPEAKRKAIGREFIRAFEGAANEILAARGAGPRDEVRFLVQGTLYPDVVESGGGEGAANIKSHHNVGGLPEDLRFELIEPLRRLFKDEVRAVAEELGLPPAIVWRQPFPGPGLAIRIVGAVTEERLAILRLADAIAREELTAAGLDHDIWQCPVVLLADVRSVGVQGDCRTYGHPVVLRPVCSEDAMTADFSRIPYDVLARIATRITNEVPDVNRVVLDITSKPPGTIEWE
ncbi:MAG TPA: glutamine-hydrolyzing GMP synthase [Acidimicrobiales bacterium]|nr:glutamine-hydrolyzing GMP synthase [Acidimicrobiales bacterium]